MAPTMLLGMQQPATTTGNPNAPSFAGLLATFAAPATPSILKRPPQRDLDGLEDDVATLSYERALRAHARYRVPAAPAPSLLDAGSPIPEPRPLRIFEVIPENVEPMIRPRTEDIIPDHPSAVQVEDGLAFLNEAKGVAELELEEASGAFEPAAVRETLSSSNRNLKSTSITIRLTSTECAQLRERAQEAGLTISAYLRSCTFEAESLRAMVKDTVSKLRSDAARESEETAELQSLPRRSWWMNLWPQARRTEHQTRQQAARA